MSDDFAGGVKLSGRGMKPRFMKGPVPVVIRSKRNQLARKVRNMDKRIKKINREEELKHKDKVLAGSAIPTTGLFTLLNDVGQGDSDITRDGNDINATSIQMRIAITPNIAQLTSTFVRTLLIWDQQANGAAPALGDILDLSVITLGWLAPYNRNNQKRFKILFDKTKELQPAVVQTTVAGATTEVISNALHFKLKRKLSRMVKYDANADPPAITDIVTNSLYLICLGNQSASTPTLHLGARFYFKDT